MLFFSHYTTQKAVYIIKSKKKKKNLVSKYDFGY